MTGHVPEHIVKTFLSLEERGESSVTTMLEDPDGLGQFDAVMRHVVCHCSHDPVIRAEYPGEDELSVEEIDYADRKHLFLYLTKQLPDAAVATDQGSVTVDAVTRFRAGAEGQAIALDSGDGADVQSAAVKAVGDS